MFGMDNPWGKEIQVCSNEVPSVMYGLPLSLNFNIVIYMYRGMLQQNLLKNCCIKSENI